MRIIFTFILLTHLFQYVQAQNPGDLDSTFGINGKVSTVVGTGTGLFFAIPNTVLMQPDGKILVSGFGDNFVTNADFAVVRYNTDGSLDSAFGTAGIVMTNLVWFDTQTAMVLQPDGKIVVAGFGQFSGPQSLAMARYLTDGTIDSTFGTAGIVILAAPGFNYNINKIALQSDGKIVVSGSNGSGLASSCMILRFTASGSLDNSFDSDGVVTFQLTGGLNVATAVAIQPDNKIVITGYGDNDLFISRINTDGSFDSLFGNSGSILLTSGKGMHIFLQPDNKIVVSGKKDGSCSLIRLNIDGTLDSSFANGGIMTSTAPALTNTFYQTAQQTDGKFISVATYFGIGGNRDFLVASHNSDGSVDSTFGNNGYVTTDFVGEFDEPRSLVIQQDGKIIVAGFNENASSYNFGLVRYHSSFSVGIPAIQDFSYPWSIYPNPSQGIFTLEVSNNSVFNPKTIELFNVYGQKIFHSTISTDKSVWNFSDLAKGIYLMQITDPKKNSSTKKIVIQ